MSSRILLASITALVVAVLSTGCNDTKTNRTIPPIAGVTVGGPSDTNGNGQVGVAVNEATAATVVGSHIIVENVTVDPHVSTNVTVTAPLGLRIISVPGDVGDQINVTLTSEGAGGAGTAEYFVPSIAISNVTTAPGGINEISLSGDAAVIAGEGYCLVDGQIAANRIFIDGTSLEAAAVLHVNADGLQFTPPMTLSTNGTHSLQVTVANTAPGNPTYTSNTLVFTAHH